MFKLFSAIAMQFFVAWLALVLPSCLPLLLCLSSKKWQLVPRPFLSRPSQPNNVSGCYKLSSVFLGSLWGKGRIGLGCCRLRDVVQFVSFVAIVQVVRFVSGCFTWLFCGSGRLQFLCSASWLLTFLLFVVVCLRIFLETFMLQLSEVALFLFAFTLFGLHQSVAVVLTS